MAWFRVYDSIIDDENLMELKPYQKWLWIVCLALANRSKIRGRLILKDGQPMSVHLIAQKAGVTAAQAEKTLKRFEELGLLHRDQETGAWVITNWDKRQFISDSSTERVRAHRARRRAEGLSPSVPAAVRPWVMDRFEGRCIYCGSDQNVVVDMLVPPHLGGDDHPLNLVAACRTCQAKKRNVLPTDVGLTTHSYVAASQYAENLVRLGIEGKDLEVRPLKAEKDPDGMSSEEARVQDLAAVLPSLSKEAQEVLEWINRVLPNWSLAGPLFQELLEYGERLSWPVLRQAVERTLANDVRSLRYCLRICEEWDAAGVRSLEALRERDARLAAEKQSRPSRSRRQLNAEPVKKSSSSQYDRFVDR